MRYPLINIHKIIHGDSRQMNLLADQSVHLVITSPPYWQLKDYGNDKQIGFHESYESYINNLNLVWKECCRVLHPGCRLCINIGDQFARSVYYGRYKVIPIRTEIINAHLIKSGFVDVDTKLHFKDKDKFISLRKECHHAI